MRRQLFEQSAAFFSQPTDFKTPLRNGNNRGYSAMQSEVHIPCAPTPHMRMDSHNGGLTPSCETISSHGYGRSTRAR